MVQMTCQNENNSQVFFSFCRNVAPDHHLCHNKSDISGEDKKGPWQLQASLGLVSGGGSGVWHPKLRSKLRSLAETKSFCPIYTGEKNIFGKISKVFSCCKISGRLTAFTRERWVGCRSECSTQCSTGSVVQVCTTLWVGRRENFL